MLFAYFFLSFLGMICFYGLYREVKGTRFAVYRKYLLVFVFASFTWSFLYFSWYNDIHAPIYRYKGVIQPKIHRGIFYRFDTSNMAAGFIYKNLGNSTPEIMSFLDVLFIGLIGCGILKLDSLDKPKSNE